MEENIFKDYLNGYVNVHNELLDINISDKNKEIERLTKIIEANDQIVRNYMKVEDINSNDKEKHKEFESGTEQYMDNIKKAEKEIHDINQQINKQKELEDAKANIRSKAKVYKEELLAKEHENKLNNESQNKIYEYNAKEHEINEKLEKFKDIELETTAEEVERIKLENDLRKIQSERKTIQQQLNQETDMSKKIEKDYILFLGQLSLIDKNPEKIEIINNEQEKQNESEQEKIEQEKVEQEKQDEGKQENIKQEKGTQVRTTKTESGIPVYTEEKKIKEISINEQTKEIISKTKDGTIYTEGIEEAILAKRRLYKTFKLNEICKEVAGGKLKGILLGTKINPAIVYALRNDPEMIEKYISCLNDKKELPFNLEHNLKNSSLLPLNKLKMWICARAEDKIPGTKITFSERFWNKNKAISAPEKTEGTKQRTIQEEIKVDNKDNKIEKQANEQLEQTQEEMAKEVKETIKEEEK